MIEFELRDAIRNSFREEIIDGVTKIIFNITLVAGIIGNPYPGFLNSNNAIEVICDKSMTGNEMEQKIIEESVAFINNNFKSI